MKIAFNQLILDLNNKPLESNGQPFTLRNAAQEALLATFADEPNLPAVEKIKRFTLAQKIAPMQVVEISIEEAATIKELVGKAYGPLIVGRVYALIEEATK